MLWIISKLSIMRFFAMIVKSRIRMIKFTTNRLSTLVNIILLNLFVLINLSATFDLWRVVASLGPEFHFILWIVFGVSWHCGRMRYLILYSGRNTILDITVPGIPSLPLATPRSPTTFYRLTRLSLCTLYRSLRAFRSLYRWGEGLFLLGELMKELLAVLE